MEPGNSKEVDANCDIKHEENHILNLIILIGGMLFMTVVPGLLIWLYEVEYTGFYLNFIFLDIYINTNKNDINFYVF